MNLTTLKAEEFVPPRLQEALRRPAEARHREATRQPRTKRQPGEGLRLTEANLAPAAFVTSIIEPDDLKQQRIQINQAEMIDRISSAVPEDGLLEGFPGVVLGRFSKPTGRVYSVFKPSFCIIAQGSKQVLLGEETFRYDPGHYLIWTVVLPIVSNVVEATEEQPYLGFQLNLDAKVLASVMMESGIEN